MYLPILWPACLLMAAIHCIYVLVVDMESFFESSVKRCSMRSTNTMLPQLITRWPRAMMVLFLTASLGLVSWGSRHVRIEGWKFTSSPPCLKTLKKTKWRKRAKLYCRGIFQIGKHEQGSLQKYCLKASLMRMFTCSTCQPWCPKPPTEQIHPLVLQ